LAQNLPVSNFIHYLLYAQQFPPLLPLSQSAIIHPQMATAIISDHSSHSSLLLSPFPQLDEGQIDDGRNSTASLILTELLPQPALLVQQ
jgi:hypothetical protein